MSGDRPSLLGSARYTRAGAVERNGERLQRYAIVGTDNKVPPALQFGTYGGSISGSILVDTNGVPRSGEVSLNYRSGRTRVVRFERRDEPPRVPDWLERAQSLPPAPWHGGGDQPQVRVEYRNGTMVLVAERRWTPPANTTLLVDIVGPEDTHGTDTRLRENVRVPVATNRSLFRHRVNGTYRSYVYATEAGLTVAARPPGPNVSLVGEPRIYLIEADGLNYYGPRGSLLE